MKWDTSCKVPSTVPGTTYVLNKFSSITGVICQFHSYIILHSEKVFPILSQKSVSQKLLPLPVLPSVPTEHPRFLDSNLSISFYSICAIISQSLMLWLPAYECCLICQHSQKTLYTWTLTEQAYTCICMITIPYVFISYSLLEQLQSSPQRE